MAAQIKRAHGETERHARLKRLAFFWAQAQGYSACAMEVNLPKCRYRADVAAYRLTPKRIGSTAIFECKQALCDLRRDNCQSDAARQRLETICQRRQLLETRLRTHYPNLRNGDSLFPEFDLSDFTVIGHRGYVRILRELRALQNRLYDCTKFDKLLAIAARTCISSFCPRTYSAIRRFLSAGALLSKPTVRSTSCVNQAGTKQQPSVTFGFYTESPWPGHE